MCYIWKCFGWMLDFLQRILTFFLACIMSCVICIGFTLAVGAGIAYGYNFSLAEFLTYGKSDVSVYVRRGQFSDNPQMGPILRRRSGDDESDLFSSNYTSDYQDRMEVPREESKPLADAWQKAQDTRNYADRLTKYSKQKTGDNRASIEEELQKENEEMAANRVLELTKPLEDDLSVIPNPSSKMNDSSPSGIIPERRRLDSNVLPLHMFTPSDDTVNNDAGSKPHKKHKHKKLRKPDIKIEVGDDPKSFYVVPLKWNMTDNSDEFYSQALNYKKL